MARGANITVENSFTRGLVTEFSAMNYPENAITDGDNCVFSELGHVTRRLGVDYELDAQVHQMSSLSGVPNTGLEAYAEYEWFSVGDEGSTKLVVQQIGRMLRFFEAGDGSLSNGLKSFSVDLIDYRPVGNTLQQVRETTCQFTSGNGYLFVVSPFINPIYVKYNPDTDDIEVNEITIEIRDLQGVEDSLEIDERPTTLSNLHNYNLLNQGWYHEIGGDTVLELWDAEETNFPSNADIWWLFKNAEEEFRPARAEKFTMGNTPAPKGHYIYPAFDVNRNDKTGLTGLPRDTAGPSRPAAVCWYAGRVWYAGVRRDKYSSTLYFSQLVERDDQFGKCYQVNDPTSETVFDLIDTDGGTIQLPLVEEVIALKVLNDALLIIGSNAIYTVRGSDNGPFKATDFTVQYVSAVGAVSHLSMVEAEGAILWFNYEGIYALNPDQLGISFVVNNISKQTIQSIVDDIPVDNRDYVKGAYNKREQVVRWIYSDDPMLPYFRYNRMLDFNVASKAFYTHKIDTTLTPRICGILTLAGEVEVTVDVPVLDVNEEYIYAQNGELVTVPGSQRVPRQQVFKFPTCGRIFSINAPGFTYSEMRDPALVDWKSRNNVGVSYDSYGLSGYRIRGEMLRSFNANPIAVVVRNVPDGYLDISGVWDYGARQSTKCQIYRPTAGDYIIRKVALRGKGKSLQIKFESAAGKPFNISGWSTFDTGGSQP